MLDVFSPIHKIDLRRREDRALLRSNPSARLLPKHGRGSTASRQAPAMPSHVLALNAINLYFNSSNSASLFTPRPDICLDLEGGQ
jgi:hypothetical protein